MAVPMTIDYYLRLSREQLKQLSFRHLESHVDLEASRAAGRADQEGAWLSTEIGGYTEWADTADQGYSLGWDWYVHVPSGAMDVRPHSIRTNIMLITPEGADLGRAQTEQGLQDWLSCWNWAIQVLDALKSEGCEIR